MGHSLGTPPATKRGRDTSGGEGASRRGACPPIPSLGKVLRADLVALQEGLEAQRVGGEGE